VTGISLAELLAQVRACRTCESALPLGCRPTLRAGIEARILIVGQAPGRKVHETGIPWNDPSGDRLRQWLNLSRAEFYDESVLAIIPTGMCYPGKGKGGDLPPRPECAPKWHPQLRAALPNIQLTLLIGSYAQAFYLQNNRRKTLADTVAAWREYLPEYLPLPHPSPRNIRWFKRHPWFDAEVVPALRERVQAILKGPPSTTAYSASDSCLKAASTRSISTPSGR